MPFEKGQHKEGVAHGPEAIKATGLIAELQSLGEYYPLDSVTFKYFKSTQLNQLKFYN